MFGPQFLQIIAAGVGAFSSAREASVSVAERETLQHLSHLNVLELEKRRLCCVRRRMAPKQGMRKRPAAGSNETVGDLQPGLPLGDGAALDRRAKQAATEAAARYPTPNGFSISCVCIGQPRIDDNTSPYPEECEPNAERWILPGRPSQVRLAFKWEIFEGPSVSAIEAASCVVHLKDAVKRGVPLPAGWGPKVAALLDGSAQAAGELRGLSLQQQVASWAFGQLSMNRSLISWMPVKQPQESHF